MNETMLITLREGRKMKGGNKKRWGHLRLRIGFHVVMHLS